LGAGHEPHPAVVRTMQTAGVTVVFSAAAVTVSLAAVGVFPAHLNSFGFASLSAIIAAAGAVIVLPALLAVLGRNIDRLRLLKGPSTQDHEGFWHRLATTVMRRPLPVAAACIALLLV